MPNQPARFVEALLRTQRLSPPDLLAYQRRLLTRLLRHAVQQTDFYPKRLSKIMGPDGELDWSQWATIEPVRRADLQDHFEALCAKTTQRSLGRPIEGTSSGSTGRSVRFLNSELQEIATACCAERVFRWHQIDPAGVMARIRAVAHPDGAYPKGVHSHGWRVGSPDSEVIDLSIATTVADQVAWLQRERPQFLASYPSNLREIARFAEGNGIKLAFDAILTFAEMTTTDEQAEIEGYFGRRPIDRYGSSEVGHIAATCPACQRMHVGAEVALVEIVTDDGSPCGPGEIGRVLVTPFYNHAMPLIRYDIGDRAAFAEQTCSSGITLPTLERVYGRARNIFHFADGSRTWPVVFSKDLGRFVPNRQFQVIQRTRRLIEFRYVPVLDGQVEDHAGLSAYLRERLNPAIDVEVVSVNAIERSASGKYEDFLSLVE